MFSLFVGRICEFAARLIMMLRGYRCVEARFNKYNAECDLIMRRGKSLVLIEVKYSRQHNDAITSWSCKQRAKLARLATAYHSKLADTDLSIMFAAFWNSGCKFYDVDWRDLKHARF